MDKSELCKLYNTIQTLVIIFTTENINRFSLFLIELKLDCSLMQMKN